MATRDDHLGRLFIAELQFRLASAVRLATTAGNQPLDLPAAWSHGQHVVEYCEVALRPDQADFAACFLHRSATFLMAVGMRDAIAETVPDPKNCPDAPTRNACQIARLVRNAFAHSPFDPVWSIDADCRDVVFEVAGVARLDTTGLHGVGFDWRHYGGPLAMLKLCQFVRFGILKDTAKRPAERELPAPNEVYYQQGSMILRKID